MRKELQIGIVTIVLVSIGTVSFVNAQQKPKLSNVAETETEEIMEEPAPAISEPQENNTSEVPIENPPQPVQIQPEPQQPPKPAPTYKFSDEMTEAGIPAEYHGYVTEMLLDDNGWRTGIENVWQRANYLKNQPLLSNLQYANNWVVKQHGTWQVAHDLWTNSGNF